MAGLLAISSQSWPSSLAAAAPGAANGENVLSPILILVLCVVAGIGTLLLLPARREEVLRKVGAVILIAAGLVLAAFLIHYVGTQERGGMSIYFWLFSIIAIVGAIRVITHRRPVYSALYFVLSVLATAGLFILLWAEFMAAALVIIYAGAILVTYVFVIMLATHSAAPGDTEGSEMGALNEYDAVSREPLLTCAVGFTLMGVLLFVIFDRAPTGPAIVGSAMTSDAPGSVQAVGRYLFTNQLVNLELAGLMLKIGMGWAILIAPPRNDGGIQNSDNPQMPVGPAPPPDGNPATIPGERPGDPPAT